MSKTLTYVVDVTIDETAISPERVEQRLGDALNWADGIVASYIQYLGEVDDLDPIIHGEQLRLPLEPQ